jgi:uncharacterized membrane protein
MCDDDRTAFNGAGKLKAKGLIVKSLAGIALTSARTRSASSGLRKGYHYRSGWVSLHLFILQGGCHDEKEDQLLLWDGRRPAATLHRLQANEVQN